MKIKLNLTQKFLGFLLLTSIIPLTGLGISSYQVSRQTLQQEAISYTASLVSNQKDYLELQLKQVENLIMNISGVDEIVDSINADYPSLNTYDRLSTQARIGYILNGYTNLEGLISIDVFSMHGPRFHVGDTLDISKIRSEVKHQIFVEALRSDRRIVWTGIEDNVNANSTSQKVITAARILEKTNPETLKPVPVGMLLVNYSADYLYDHFNQLNLGQGSYLLVIDSKNRIIYHPDKTLFGVRINSELTNLLQETSGSFVRVIDQQEMLITYTYSEMSGWAILSFVPLETLVAPTTSIGATTSLALSLSFLVILLAAWVVSTMVVQPLRQIKERFELFQQGSLDWQAPLVAQGKDEIGELVTWFNTFVESWRARQRAEDALRESLQRERATLRVVERIRQTLDLNQIFETTAVEIRQLLKCDRVVIFRCNHQQQTAEYVTESSNSKESIDSPKIIDPDSPFIPGRSSVDHYVIHTWRATCQPALLEGEPRNECPPVKDRYLAVPDVYQLVSEIDHLQALEALKMRAFLVVPLFRGHDFWGLLMSYQNTEPREWEATEINLVVHVSTQLGIAIHQAELLVQTQQQSADLEKARDAAEAANRAKSNFLANMSHELRTPLNAILGFTQLLSKDPSTPSTQQETLTIINQSGEQLLRLINDVLNMSKIEADQISLNEHDFDIYKLLDVLQQTYTFKVQKSSLTLSFECDETIPQFIYADEAKIQQVLSNLLNNAIKFTETGNIILRVKGPYANLPHPLPQVPQGESLEALLSESHWQSSHHSRALLILEVEDTGPGMTEDELARVFEPFVQTETGRYAQQGVGLGLSISHRLVQCMKGEITIHSTPGSGTLFRVILPVVLPVQPRFLNQPQAVIGLAPGQPGYRILIADDVASNRQILIQLLQKLGFSTQEAENGQQAVEVWQQWHPHLILMDIRMPVMDGFTAVRAIRQQERAVDAASHLSQPMPPEQPRPTVILALTAHAFEEDQEKILIAGCDDCLVKPFKFSTLLNLLAQHLQVEYAYQPEEEIVTAKTPRAHVPEPIKGEPAGNPLLSQLDLSDLSPEWVQQLYEASIRLNQDAVLELIATMPETQATLANSLTHLVKTFRFDLLIDLAKPAT